MDIDSSSKDAARRNLVTLSMLFILFWFAEGSLILTPETEELTVKLPYIPITFGKPSVLKYFVWTMLGWFLFRFWQFSDHNADWDIYAGEMYHSKLMSKWLIILDCLAYTRQNENSNILAYPIFEDWNSRVQ